MLSGSAHNTTGMKGAGSTWGDAILTSAIVWDTTDLSPVTLFTRFAECLRRSRWWRNRGFRVGGHVFQSNSHWKYYVKRDNRGDSTILWSYFACQKCCVKSLFVRWSPCVWRIYVSISSISTTYWDLLALRLLRKRWQNTLTLLIYLQPFPGRTIISAIEYRPIPNTNEDRY